MCLTEVAWNRVSRLLRALIDFLIKDIYNEKQSSFFLFLFLAVLLFVLHTFGFFFFSMPKNILDKNIGIEETTIFFIILMIVFIACCIIYFILRLIFKSQSWNFNKYDWCIRTFLIMLPLLIAGMFFLHSELGVKNSFIISGKTDVSQNISVTCSTQDTALFVGSQVSCVVKPDLHNWGVSTILHYDNVSKPDITGLDFIAPESIKSISFSIHWYDSGNKEHAISLGKAHPFLNTDEFQQQREKFITYLLALFGIVIFSIPSLMINLKELVTQRGNDEK